MNKILKIFIYLVLFSLFMFLIISSQKEQTLIELSKMFLGLFGLIALLGIYNKEHR